jgi:hypothetical protein
MAAEGKTFRQSCCDRLQIPPEGFEETVLWQCLPPRHLLIGKIRWRFDRAYFKDDLELIRSVADCTDLEELRAELTYFRSLKRNSGFQRGILRARLSGQRLVDFASTFLPSH